MIMYDYRCPAGHVHEALVKMSDRDNPQDCTRCDDKAERMLLTPPKWDWGKMGATSDGHGFADRFKRVHEQQAEKERLCLAEHGDYGPRPGAD